MMLKLKNVFDQMSDICKLALIDFTKDLEISEDYEKINKYRFSQGTKHQVPVALNSPPSFERQNKFKIQIPNYQTKRSTKKSALPIKQQRKEQLQPEQSAQKAPKPLTPQKKLKNKRGSRLKHKAQIDPKRRINNGFLSFFHQIRYRLKVQHKTQAAKQLGRLASLEWKQLTIEQKNKYNQTHWDQKQRLLEQQASKRKDVQKVQSKQISKGQGNQDSISQKSERFYVKIKRPIRKAEQSQSCYLYQSESYLRSLESKGHPNGQQNSQQLLMNVEQPSRKKPHMKEYRYNKQPSSQNTKFQ